MSLWQIALIQIANFSMIGLDIPALFHWSADKGFLFLHAPSGIPAPDGAEWCGRFPWISQAWSVGSEIWFYMLAPLLTRTTSRTQAVIAAGSIAIMVSMQQLGLDHYYFFPANLWLFIAGSLMFRAYPTVQLVGQSYGHLVFAVVVGLCLFGGPAMGGFFAWPIICVLIASIPLIFARYQSSRINNAIGELSYPVYLAHLLVISIMRTVLKVDGFVIAGVASSVVAFALVRGVEEPMNRFRQRRHTVVAGGDTAVHFSPPQSDIIPVE